MAERVLVVKLIGDERSLQQAFLKGSRAGGQFEKNVTGNLGRVSLGFKTLVKATLVIDLVQKALEGLNKTVHDGITEFNEHSQVTAQTNAVLKSTGGIANVTAKHVDELGLQLSNLSGIDDEVIQKGENLLLSFTNIRDFAGKNNDIFTQSTKILTDFAVRTGKDVPQAAVILGRALADPATRIASLSRAGVVFTKQQVNQIKAIEKTKGVLAAQKVLLKELEERYGGAAKAAGETLPGQLAVLHDRFKDLAGTIVGIGAPSVTKATVALTDFVKKISETHGTRAKFEVVFTGIKNVGADLLKSIENAVAGIDFAAIGDRVRDKIAAIDWHAKIVQAGKEVGRSAVALLESLSKALESVNWQIVGRDIAVGIEKALGAAALFIVSLKPTAIAKAVARVVIDVLNAQEQLLVGAGKLVGGQLVHAIGLGIDAAAKGLERTAIKLTLDIIEPFTHLPGFLGGGPFRQMKEGLQKTLADMATAGARGGAAVGQAITVSMSQAIADGLKATRDEVLNDARQIAIAAGNRFKGGAPGLPDLPGLPAPPGPPAPAARPGVSASQRNTWFDSMISRLLDRVQDVPTIKGQVAKLKQISDLIAQRIAVTKDITRKLNLEDQLISVRRQIKPLQQQIRDAAQFFTLGLDPTGGERVPLVKTLRKQLANVSDAVSGTFLDTKKTRSVLSHIASVLKAGIGKVSVEVRSAIKGMLDDIDNQLKNHTGNLTRFRHVATEALLAGLGLDPVTARILEQRLSRLGPGGTVPANRSPAFAGAGANSNTYVTLVADGKTLAQVVTPHQRRAQQRRSGSRRGPYAGRT